ncbi:hypothetical protein [Burkholderia ubonensis]|uniref:hypothetical protein n=1 Tax=Burkholderia ubonensis TaxID=101571 RepID=UPI001E2A86C6|nr:hypothetical protein [Burkholderia ubonensis]
MTAMLLTAELNNIVLTSHLLRPIRMVEQHAEAHGRGAYRGNIHHFRHLVALHRPRPTHEAYLRLRTTPGEVGKVDWASFGHLQIDCARRPLMAFMMVLAWSRQIWLRFYRDARMDSFLAGHVGAFEAWSGLPRVLRYDNLRSAVLERQGDAIRFNPALLAFASHYGSNPGRWPSRGEMKKVASKERFALHARASLPRAGTTISMI